MKKQIAWLLLAACLCAAGAAWADTGTVQLACRCGGKLGCAICASACVCAPAVETVEIERITTHPNYTYTAFTLPHSMTVYSSASGQGIEGVLVAGAEVDIGTPILGRNPILYQGGTRAGYVDLAEAEAKPAKASGNDTIPETEPPRSGWQLEDGQWYYYKDGKRVDGWTLGTDLNTRDWIFSISDSGTPQAKSRMEFPSGWTYLSPSSDAMQTDSGFVWDSGTSAWFYPKQGWGASRAVNEWVYIDGQWCFIGADGSILKNTLNPDGHKVDETGKWVN